MPTRCFWPPDSWRGRRLAKSRGSFTVSSSWTTRSLTLSGSFSTPNFLITRPIWPPTLWLGFSVSNGFWKTICRWRWSAACASAPAAGRAPGRPADACRRSPARGPSAPWRRSTCRSRTRRRCATVSASRASKSMLLVGLDRRARACRGPSPQELSRIVVIFLQVVDSQHHGAAPAAASRSAALALRRPVDLVEAACSARRGPDARHAPPSGSAGVAARRRRSSRSAARSSSRAAARAAAAAGRGSAPAAGRSCRRPAAGSSRTGRACRGGACWSNTSPTGPTSTAWPEYITVMRWQVSRMSPRLCEM